MQWSQAYDKDSQPTWGQIEAYINSLLWSDLNAYLQRAYDVQPTLDHSTCSMQAGWNVKYRKSGSALCTLYPMPGYFIVLVVIGEKQMDEAERALPMCGDYVRALYAQTRPVMGKWLMIDVTDEERLRDALMLIATRRKPAKQLSGKSE